jgi:hypothetical protein
MPILFLLQTAFSIWMLVDAIRRRAPEYWWLIILIPFGEWVYFFAVKLPDMRFGSTIGRRLFTRRVSLDELRALFKETPSHENRLRLAQSLHDHQQYEEASELFEKVLRNDEDDKESLYGYALCCLKIDKRDMAVRALERLIDIELTFQDYAPCEDLAALYQEDGRQDLAIALLQRACKQSQRIGPRRILAGYLLDAGRADDARPLLEEGLTTYNSSPHFVRRRDRREARAARALLRSLL